MGAMAISHRFTSALALFVLPVALGCGGADMSSNTSGPPGGGAQAGGEPAGGTGAVASGQPPTASAPTSAPAAGGEGAAGAVASGQPPTATAPAPQPEKPKTAAECKAGALSTPKPTISATEVQQQMRDFFQAYHESFRCCFDSLYASKNPGASGKVTLIATIDKEGALKETEINAADTTVASPEVHACMIDIAKALSYPKPANGKSIAYKRVFDFKARK
jgi:hypothetical protein